MKILKPTCSTRAYDIAAKEFCSIYNKVTGKNAEIITEDDGESDIIVIGSDSVNNYVYRLLYDGIIDEGLDIPSNDDYIIKSVKIGKRNILLLMGGNGRSTIYAVYRYFEEFCGCSYFWDGDILSHCDEIPVENIMLIQKQRFKYRGIRYFAHRGLHRFRAEHWDFEDWKREIDWIMKKGLNMFMLRIGNDDLFQKAFPDIVPYPSNNSYLFGNTNGYWDTTPSWSLKFRGELRDKIIKYAVDRELMQPIDCGTMSHWYSQTPPDFIEKVKPRVVEQFEGDAKYSSIWDIRCAENIDNYFKLTKAEIERGGGVNLFHTVGYAEHNIENNSRKNMYMKSFMYRRTLEYKNRINPDAPLLLAAWDFWNTHKNEEVKALLANFRDDNIIVLDYTSDTKAENNFTKWGVIGNIPYIFGMFHGYSSQCDIREDYAQTQKRLGLVLDDKFCIGMVYWPELSHGDTFSLEFFADNTRMPLNNSLDKTIYNFCSKRYPGNTEKMANIWSEVLSFTQLTSWSMSIKNECTHYQEFYLDVIAWVHFIREKNNDIDSYFAGFDFKGIFSMKSRVIHVLKMLRTLDEGNNEFIRRDKYDIVRTIVFRYIAAMMFDTVDMLRSGEYSFDGGLTRHKENTLELVDCAIDLLSQHEDYIMSATFERLKAVSEINPVFEHTLKKNANCSYNRSQIYELAKYIYKPEIERFFEFVEKSEGEGFAESSYFRELEKFQKENTILFFETPLSDMKPDNETCFDETVQKIENVINNIS